jgi:hypothetical protein
MKTAPVSLDGMTQQRWDSLSHAQRAASRDLGGLTKQFVGLEGCRVEVTDKYGDTRRFIVGISTGWRPRNIEVKTARSDGGIAADSEYTKVTVIRRVR